MDPFLEAALPNIIMKMRQSGQLVAAQELEAYLKSGGTAPLSAATLMLAEPAARAQGTSIVNRTRNNANGPDAPGNPENQPVNSALDNPAIPAPAGGAPRLVAGGGAPPAAQGGPQGGPLPVGHVNVPQDDPYVTQTRVGASAPSGDNPFTGTPGMVAQAGTSAGQAGAAAAQAAASAASQAGGNRGGGTPMPGAPGGGGGVPGGFSASFGDVLGGNNDMLTRFALQAAGFNPDIVTPASKIAAQKLAALAQSRRAGYGALNADQSSSGLPQDIAAFAKEYTTPGQDFYGHARQYAQQVLAGLGGGDSALNGVADQSNRFGMYQSLVPMLYGGANPMIQQSAADQLSSAYDKWQMADAMNPGQNADILKFIQTMPNLSPVLRSIFGPQK